MIDKAKLDAMEHNAQAIENTARELSQQIESETAAPEALCDVMDATRDASLMLSRRVRTYCATMRGSARHGG